jgi:thioredoxin reductase (NADPH)
MNTSFDLIVVGEGIAGLACAGEAAKLGLKVASFEGGFSGGLVMNVVELEGFEEGEGLSGMDHAMLLAMANKKAGVAGRQEAVSTIRAASSGFEVDTDAGTFTARAVVMATGAQLKKLAVPGEEDYQGRGVSHCADCDAPMFTGEHVVVAGGGDSAFQEALVLAQECAAVHIVHDQANPTAHPRFLEAAQAHDNIRTWPNRRVEEVLGDDKGMTGVRLRVADGGTEDLAAAGLFAYIGLQPSSEAAPAQARRDGQGALVTGEDLQTSVPGLWAIGQVRSGFGGRLADAAEEGRRAAGNVKAFLG